MCGRFTLRTPASKVAQLFEDLELTPPDLDPRYNIAPTQPIAAVREKPSPTSGRKTFAAEWVTLRWGLIPFWAKDRSIGNQLINARGETIASKPSFRAAFKSRRCLIPADGFYEWKKLNSSKKQPQYITLKDQRPFCFAGLWESWTDKESNEDVQSCTIITTDANELLLPLHDRMPVILDPSDYRPWLDRDFKDVEWLTSKLQPWPADAMAFYPVDTTVNNPRNERPECIQAVEG
jgi:putative SOS response-associated peptidase YedK